MCVVGDPTTLPGLGLKTPKRFVVDPVLAPDTSVLIRIYSEMTMSCLSPHGFLMISWFWVGLCQLLVRRLGVFVDQGGEQCAITCPSSLRHLRLETSPSHPQNTETFHINLFQTWSSSPNQKQVWLFQYGN